MSKEHHYKAVIRWTGNKGAGTGTYSSYERSHIISIEGKSDLLASSDAAFQGDPGKHNPEDLFLSSLSACHMLWYLHLCSVSKVVVIDYIDYATGVMEETDNGSGFFKEVSLHPVVRVKSASMLDMARKLHSEANKMCFIANSVKIPVYHLAEVEVVDNK